MPPSIGTGAMVPSHQVSRPPLRWAWRGTVILCPARARACMASAMSRVWGNRPMTSSPSASSALRPVERSQSALARRIVPSGATRHRPTPASSNSRSASALPGDCRVSAMAPRQLRAGAPATHRAARLLPRTRSNRLTPSDPRPSRATGAIRGLDASRTAPVLDLPRDVAPERRSSSRPLRRSPAGRRASRAHPRVDSLGG